MSKASLSFYSDIIKFLTAAVMLDLHDSQLKVNVLVELARSMKQMNDLQFFFMPYLEIY